MRLVSVNVGAPRAVDWNGQLITTAIYKEAVQEPRFVGRLNVEGDRQADLVGHGGEHRAVFVYQIESYRYWEKFLHRPRMAPGTFGENFTVSGMGDDEVCIGDRFRIGEALFEVTQPRVTCFKVGIRLGEPRMPALLYMHGRPGFYLRVLEEGIVAAGAPIERVGRGPEQLSVRETSALLYLPGHRKADLHRALRISALPQGWRRSFTALLEQGQRPGNRGLTPAAIDPPAWSGFRAFRVRHAQMETPSVRSLELEPVDDEPLSSYQAGQYVTIRLEPGEATQPLVRTYSLSAAPSNGRWRISVKREPEGRASPALHDTVQVGDEVRIGAPRGQFVLPADDLPLVFIGAGIGVTPLLSMLGRLVATNDPREVWWVYSARNAIETPHDKEINTRLAALDAHVRVHHTRPDARTAPPARPIVNRRLAPSDLPALGAPRQAHFLVCGPERFMDGMMAGLLSWGVTPEHIHRESFSPARMPAARTLTRPALSGERVEANISLARSGVAVGWDPGRYGSLLELVEAFDVPVTWSCRTGACHLCETGLISGSVRYDPQPLDAPAEGSALLCCSVPRTDVVLDL